MFKWLRAWSSKTTNVHDIGERKNDDLSKIAFEDIPRYPPFLKGLPAVDPKLIIETQGELIQRIRNSCNADQEIFDKHYKKPMLRFAEYAHLLPASQSHHHRGAGGLIRHSLEVGLYALQDADRVIIMPKKPPSVRREIEIRWQAACFLAGLCHDAGKPISDLSVFSHTGENTWNPLLNSIYDWASTAHVKHYYIEWRSGRARQHVPMATLISERLIGQETLGWLAEYDKDIIVWLVESLSGNVGGKIYDLVLKSDKISVEKDLREMAAPMAGHDIGVPTEKYLIDVMRRLVANGVWKINSPGARAWKIDGNLYLIWPISGEEMVREIIKDNVPAIPRSPQGIRDLLCERGFVFLVESNAGNENEWRIYPKQLTDKMNNIVLEAIKLKDDSMLSDVPIKNVAGHVAADDQLPLSLQTDHENNMAAAKKESSSNIIVQASDDQVSSEPKAEANVESASNVLTPIAEQSKTKIKLPKTPSIDIKTIDGALGEAIKALINDCALGVDKIVGKHVLFKDDDVYLLWPDAFAGYGLSGKLILDALVNNKWLMIDIEKPMIKTWDFKLSEKESVKAIKLSPQLGMAIKEMLCTDKQPDQNNASSANTDELAHVDNVTDNTELMLTDAEISYQIEQKRIDIEVIKDKFRQIVKSIPNIQEDLEGWVEIESKALKPYKKDSFLSIADMMVATNNGLIIMSKRGMCKLKVL